MGKIAILFKFEVPTSKISVGTNSNRSEWVKLLFWAILRAKIPI